MMPRKDSHRRKLEDDYKPRRFKTIAKMAKAENATVEDLIMVDDPSVYSQHDRCNGSLIHILAYDDPLEQRDDDELNKLRILLEYMLKYGKNYYNKVFARCIKYSGVTASIR